MIHHIAVSLGTALPSSGFSYADALHAVPEQERQPLPAPGIPLFIMAGKGQHDYQFNITVLRLFFQSEYNFARPLINAQTTAHQKLSDAFFIECDKLIVHPLL